MTIRQRGKDAHMINLTMKLVHDVGGLLNPSGEERLVPSSHSSMPTAMKSNHTGYAMENGRYRCDGETGSFVDPEIDRSLFFTFIMNNPTYPTPT